MIPTQMCTYLLHVQKLLKNVNNINVLPKCKKNVSYRTKIKFKPLLMSYTRF